MKRARVQLDANYDIGGEIVDDPRTGVHVATVKVQVTYKRKPPLGPATLVIAEEVGSARCHPDDEYMSEIGSELALARALRRAGKYLEKSVEQRIDEITHCRNRETREARREQRLKERGPQVLAELLGKAREQG